MTAEQPLFSSLLAHRALDKAAVAVVDHVKRCLADNERILITDDPDLASSDAVYHHVQTGYDRLVAAAEKFLDSKGEEATPEADPQTLVAGEAVLPALDTLAGALPSVASLVSPLRTTSSYATTVDTTAAMGLVAGLLTGAGRTVQLDGFRLVPQGRIARLDRNLTNQRSRLAATKADLEQRRAQAEARRVEAAGRVAELRKELAASSGDGDARELENDLEDELDERDRAAAEAGQAGAMVGLISELLAAIDAFTTAVHTVPSGEKRSPFVDASLREQLHGPKAAGPPQTRRFGKVLFIKAVSGSADQLFNDLPLWTKDRFHTMGSLSLSYYLLDLESATLMTGGVVTGSAQVTGKIGERFTITSDLQ
jgi:hypothetical protein